MSDLSKRLVQAASDAIDQRNGTDGGWEREARAAAIGVLRELDVIVGEAFWRGAPGPDLVVLADEIEARTDD